MRVVTFLTCIFGASAINLRSTNVETSCSDAKVRAKMQNKLASLCEDMCKELGAYPLCGGCPNFVAPDSTPGVMTWEELLEHMDNLSAWGHDEIKAWTSRASGLIQENLSQMSCDQQELHHRVAVQNKLAGICEDMCKEVGAYPKCACPGFVAPDATPGVFTWDELLEHMDNLVEWGSETIKGWHAQAGGALVQVESCEKSDTVVRAKMQNKLASLCEDMCKELGAYPLCGGCPNFVAPDSTPGVMTWEELLEHMDNLSAWGHDEIKSWVKRAGALVQENIKGMSCQKQELHHRVSVQNKLAGICEDMCKEVGAYPKCTCPGFVAPDATPGVMTWDELLEHMDNLVEWSAETIKGWHSQAGALVQVESCEKADTVVRSKMQNKLASLCEDMCKELGAYPLCGGCPNFVAPDATPGVMTWEELLEHMDNLSAWGHDEIKSWVKRAGALVQQNMKATSCQKQELHHRATVQNKLAGICEDMCKEVGAYPKCTCPGFVAPDATPGVMTWDELLEHMDNLVEWSAETIKGWHAQASALVQVESCEKSETVVRAKMQNKLASLCEDMCKELGAYPLCGGCPNFVAPDSTPGVMTWEELLEHMDNLSEWGHGEIKAWVKRAGALIQQKLEGTSCQKQSLVHRATVQNKLAGICEDMCKEVGAYPKCACPGFVAPDATPGVMTWDELLEHMDNLVEWGSETIKGWHSQASQLQVVKAKALRH